MTFGIASNFNQIHVWASNICIQSDSRISQVFFFLEFFESKARSAVVAFHSYQHVPEISVSTPSPPEPTTEPNSIRLHARRFVHKSRSTNENIYCFRRSLAHARRFLLRASQLSRWFSFQLFTIFAHLSSGFHSATAKLSQNRRASQTSFLMLSKSWFISERKEFFVPGKWVCQKAEKRSGRCVLAVMRAAPSLRSTSGRWSGFSPAWGAIRRTLRTSRPCWGEKRIKKQLGSGITRPRL